MTNVKRPPTSTHAWLRGCQGRRAAEHFLARLRDVASVGKEVDNNLFQVFRFTEPPRRRIAEGQPAWTRIRWRPTRCSRPGRRLPGEAGLAGVGAPVSELPHGPIPASPSPGSRPRPVRPLCRDQRRGQRFRSRGKPRHPGTAAERTPGTIASGVSRIQLPIGGETDKSTGADSRRRQGGNRGRPTGGAAGAGYVFLTIGHASPFVRTIKAWENTTEAPGASSHERRRKLAEARQRTPREDLELRQRTLPFQPGRVLLRVIPICARSDERFISSSVKCG